MSRKPSHKRPAKGTSVPETHFGRSRNELRPVAAIVARVARDLWATKRDVELAYRMACTPRTAQNVLAGRFDPSGEYLLNLINSDIGVVLVRAMTERSVQTCWRRFRRTVEISDLRRAHAQQRSRLEALEVEAGD